MTNRIQLGVAAALILAIAPAVALSQTAAKAPAKAAPAKSAWKAPRLSDGRPDIGGFWENSTMTPLERQTKFGDRRAYTEDEVRQVEGDTAVRNKRINAPTDPRRTGPSWPRGPTRSTNAGAARRGWRAATTPAGPIRATTSCGWAARRGRA